MFAGLTSGVGEREEEEVKKIIQSANRLVEQTATPYEKFIQKRKEVNELFDQGAISGDVASRGIRQAFEEYQRTDEAQQRIIENERRLEEVSSRRAQGLKDAADRIRESIKTPADRLADELEELKAVAAENLLSPEQFDIARQAIEDRRRELDGAATRLQASVQNIGPILGGRLAEQILGKDDQTLEQRMLAIQKANLDTAKKIERNTRNAGAVFQ